MVNKIKRKANKGSFIPGPMSASDMEKTPEAIAAAGWSVVVPGEVYKAMIELLDTLQASEGASQEGQAFVFQLRHALLTEGVPVKPKVNRIVVP